MGLQIKLRYLYDLIGGDNPFDDVFEDTISNDFKGLSLAAGIYLALWRPYTLDSNWSEGMTHQGEFSFEKASRVKARELIIPLTKGLIFLREEKEFEDAISGGFYGSHVLEKQVEKYLLACTEDPDSFVFVDRDSK